MQPRCVQVVEIAASLFPSRTMHTRFTSIEMRVPDGKSSGLPIAKRCGCPYVARGLMKTRLETALKIAEPNSPTLLSQMRNRRRPAGSSTFWVLACMFVLVQIAPENLVFGVLDVLEIISFDGKNK